MARSNPAAESWGAWLRQYVPSRMSQAELVRAINSAGGDVAKQTVSQWVNGSNSPDANSVVFVARALRADQAEAFTAAGFGPVAEVIVESRGGGPVPSMADEADPNLRDLLADPQFTSQTPRAQQKLLDFYYRQRAQAAAEMRILGDLDDEPGQRHTA